MLPRSLSDVSNRPTLWQELSEGAATIIGFAEICSQALQGTAEEVDSDRLSDEAKAILAVAAERGVIEIRAQKDGFDSVERFLAVCVEYAPEQRLLFLQKENPRQTVRFLEGFRQLCQAGLVLHHLQRDFSLSSRGFEVAQRFSKSEFQALVEFGMELEI